MSEHVNRLIVRGSDVKAGARFGRLRVLGATFRARIEDRWESSHVVCQCSCGTVLVLPCGQLGTNKVKSCGCHRRALTRAK